MTIKETIAACKSFPGITCRYSAEWGNEYRVTFTAEAMRAYYPQEGREVIHIAQEENAYYTQDSEDAIGTAKYMSANRRT